MRDARLVIDLVNERSEIPRLAAIVDQFGAAHHLAEDDVANIRLAVDEIVINVIIHGYEDVGDDARHRIQVTIELAGDLLTMTIDDDARAYDPRSAPPPQFNLPLEQRRRGGLGVHIVKTIMDTFDYRRDNGHNIVTMSMRLDRSSAVPDSA